MTLREWLTANRRKQAWLVQGTGLSPAQVSRIVRGEQAASWEVAESILILTDGAVTPNDLHEQRRAWLALRQNAA